MPIGDDGNVVQRRHMIPHTVAPAKSPQSCCAYPRFAAFPSLSLLLFRFSPRVRLVLFIRKRVAIASMPRDIADAILHTILWEPRNVPSFVR